MTTISNSTPLEEAITELLRKEPGYGLLVSSMNKRLTSRVAVAAVSVTKTINLYINPEIFNQLPLTERVGILIHECKHVTHDHIGRTKDRSKRMNRAMNYAADRAINGMIDSSYAKIPDSSTISLEGLSEKTLNHFKQDKQNTSYTMKPVTKKNFQAQFPDKDIQDFESMEYYYDFLKDNIPENASEDGVSDLFDGDHDMWDESEQNADARNMVIKKALEKAKERSKGNLPGDMQDALDRLSNSAVNWKQQLSRFKEQCLKIKQESTRKKRNRRYGILYPGMKKHPELSLLVAIDTSGSVSEDDLAQFYAEITKMYSLGVDIEIALCDTQINKRFKFDKTSNFDIDGRGGTAFEPIFDLIKSDKTQWDGLIYFTDGDGDGADPKCKIPVLFVITNDGRVPEGFQNKHTFLKGN